MSLPGDNGGRGSSHEDDDDRLRKRLQELERKLGAENGEREAIPEEERNRRGSLLGKAFQISTELVAGVFLGGFLGWLLDRWLKTLPLFLVVFLMLGIAAGILNAVREARKMTENR